MIKNIFFVMLITSNFLFSSSPNSKTAYSSDDQKKDEELRKFLSEYADTPPSSSSTPLPQAIPLTAANAQMASNDPASIEKELAEIEKVNMQNQRHPINTQPHTPSRTPSPVPLCARVITIHHQDASSAAASNQPSPSSTSTNATGILDMMRALNNKS